LYIKAIQLGDEALENAQDVAEKYGWQIHNGGADAFRHCDWSGMMTRKFGWDTAKGFTDRHEERTSDEQDDNERSMDQLGGNIRPCLLLKK
jgi:hypothetical protein